MIKPYTLVIIQKGDQVLMGMKKLGFGAGWWNGFGGKIEKDESPEQGAIREVKEEVGLDVSSVKARGIIDFTFEGEEDIHQVHLFECHNFNGVPQETEEMKPQWFNIAEIPYEKMWDADRTWFPLYWEGKDINGTFNFTKDKKVSSYKLQ